MKPAIEALLAAVTHQLHQLIDVGVLRIVHQSQAAAFHQRVDLPEMFQFLLGQGDQRGNDLQAVRVFDRETQRQCRGLALAIGVVTQEGVEIIEYRIHPIRVGGL